MKGWNEEAVMRHGFKMQGIEQAAIKKASKLRNAKVEYDGKKFDSKKERDHYIKLKYRERAGEISNLECQKVLRLEVNGKLVCKFKPDFYFIENGKEVYHDAKGYKGGDRWAIYRIKVKLLEALTGLKVIET